MQESISKLFYKKNTLKKLFDYFFKINSSSIMQSLCLQLRWGGIGFWDDGQAGPCMGWCMGGGGGVGGDVDDVIGGGKNAWV